MTDHDRLVDCILATLGADPTRVPDFEQALDVARRVRRVLDTARRERHRSPRLAEAVDDLVLHLARPVPTCPGWWFDDAGRPREVVSRAGRLELADGGPVDRVAWWPSDEVPSVAKGCVPWG